MSFYNTTRNMNYLLQISQGTHDDQHELSHMAIEDDLDQDTCTTLIQTLSDMIHAHQAKLATGSIADTACLTRLAPALALASDHYHVSLLEETTRVDTPSMIAAATP